MTVFKEQIVCFLREISGKRRTMQWEMQQSCLPEKGSLQEITSSGQCEHVTQLKIKFL